jgi:hypothetical protein
MRVAVMSVFSEGIGIHLAAAKQRHGFGAAEFGRAQIGETENERFAGHDGDQRTGFESRH